MSVLNNLLGGGNIMGLALNIAGMAYPPLGIGMSLMNMFGPMLGQAVNGAMSQLCQEAGMPKFIADMVGDLAQQAITQMQQQNPSDPQCDQHVQDQWGGEMNDFASQFCKGIVDDAINNMSHKPNRGAQSWFEAVASALGNALNAQADKVNQLSQAVEGKNSTDDPKAFTDLQAASQRMSFMMSAADQVIKTLGEALGTMARKQ
jgi:hypothetical protein